MIIHHFLTTTQELFGETCFKGSELRTDTPGDVDPSWSSGFCPVDGTKVRKLPVASPTSIAIRLFVLRSASEVA